MDRALSESFGVGVDNGTLLSNNCNVKNHFPFTGQIDEVSGVGAPHSQL